jgi:hypothetical protein
MALFVAVLAATKAQRDAAEDTAPSLVGFGSLIQHPPPQRIHRGCGFGNLPPRVFRFQFTETQTRLIRGGGVRSLLPCDA